MRHACVRQVGKGSTVSIYSTSCPFVCSCIALAVAVSVYVAPNISAASRCLSGHIGAVKEKTAGAVITTERPCGWK